MHRMPDEHRNATNFNTIQPRKHGIRERAEALAAEMNDRDRWSRDRLLEFQSWRLRDMVRHAVANSTYYRRVIGQIGTGNIELKRLPVLTKATLMTEFDQIVTDRRLRLMDAEEHLASKTLPSPCSVNIALSAAVEQAAAGVLWSMISRHGTLPSPVSCDC
jgi:hypothetical protein